MSRRYRITRPPTNEALFRPPVRSRGRPVRDMPFQTARRLLTTSALMAIAMGSVRALDARLVTSDTRDLTRFLHDKIRMSDDEIAAAAGVKSGQSVRRWRSTAATNAPRNVDRLDDLRAVVVLLLQSGVLYPEEIGRWLRARNADLGQARPTVLLGKGEFDAVRRAADLHVERLEGRVLDPRGARTLENDIERFFAEVASNHEAAGKDERCVGQRGSGDAT